MGISICGNFNPDKSKIQSQKSLVRKFSKAFTKLSKQTGNEIDKKMSIAEENNKNISSIYKSIQLNNKNNENNNFNSSAQQLSNKEKIDVKKDKNDKISLLNTEKINIGKSQVNQSKSRFSYISSMQKSGLSGSNYNESSLFLEQHSLSFILRRKLQSEKMEKVKKKFFIANASVFELYKFFLKIDINNTGYISILDLYKLLGEHPSTSSVGPFMDRFFVLIEKQNFDKVSFEELLPNLLSFCLFSVYQIIEFVFHFIDKDHDNCVSKKDIQYILSLKREENQIYFDNNYSSLNNFRYLKRSDKINLEDFVLLCQKLPFIYYPAIKLQNLLKEHFIGKTFWEKLSKQIKDKYMSNMKSMENEKIQNKIQQIRNKLIEERKAKIKEMLKNKEVKIYYQDMRFERRNSDTNFFLIREKNIINGLQEDEALTEAKSFDENIIELKL